MLTQIKAAAAVDFCVRSLCYTHAGEVGKESRHLRLLSVRSSPFEGEARPVSIGTGQSGRLGREWLAPGAMENRGTLAVQVMVNPFIAKCSQRGLA